jgi:hypothetical protein
MMSDLITLARAKQAIPDVPAADEPIVEALIDAASEAISLHCRRTFALTSWDEIANGRCDGKIALKQFPIVSVSRIAVADRASLHIVNEDAVTNQRASARLTSAGLVLSRVASGVVTVDSTILWSGNQTLQSVANAVTALGAGWKGAAAADRGFLASLDLRPINISKPCLTSPAEIFVHDVESSADRIDADAGFVFGRFPVGDGKIRVEYSAGFSSIPEPIQQACATLVAQWYSEGKHDASRRFDGLGDAQYSRFTPSGLPDHVRRLLAPWRNLMA